MKSRINFGLQVAIVVVIVFIIAVVVFDRVELSQRLDAAEADNQELRLQNRGPQGPDGDPGRAPTEAEIAAAVEAQIGAAIDAYCSAHNSCVGPAGADGKDGATGVSGGYSTIDIQCIGNHWKLLVNGAVTRDLNVYCF